MKISILQGAFLPVPPLLGGAVEKMWFELGAEFAARGHEVTHVSRAFGELPAEETLRGVTHRRVPGAERAERMRTNLARDFFYTWRSMRRLPAADVIVTNTFWAPMVLRRRHGAIYVDVQRMPKGQMRFYGRAARLRANSSAVAAAIVAEAPTLAPKVRVIPNPLPFVPDRAPAWNAKAKTILFAGRLHPEKGIELLLEAWRVARTTEALKGWTLIFVGPWKISEGGGGEEWLRRLKASAPADVVWREPIYDAARLNALYEETGVLAYPSLAVKGETFGLAVLEAMAWGAVPVVSELACFRDFVVDGRNGFFFAHDGPERVAALVAALQRAAGGEGRAAAERGLAVRESHSCSSIAGSFLEDFAQLKGMALSK